MDNPGLGMTREEEIWGYSQTTKLNIMRHSGSRKFQKRASKKYSANKHPRHPFALITVA
jgi:hypothetical protein